MILYKSHSIILYKALFIMFFARQNRSFFKDIYRKSVFLRYSTYENINVFDIIIHLTAIFMTSMFMISSRQYI